jgi:WD40 repeat protein
MFKFIFFKKCSKFNSTPTIICKGSAAALPATSLRFRPSTDPTRTKNVLVSTNAVGAIQHWHVTSGKCLHTTEEKNNQVFALDYRPDGMFFATGGKDHVIKIYDEATKDLTTQLKVACPAIFSFCICF